MKTAGWKHPDGELTGGLSGTKSICWIKWKYLAHWSHESNLLRGAFDDVKASFCLALKPLFFFSLSGIFSLQMRAVISPSIYASLAFACPYLHDFSFCVISTCILCLFLLSSKRRNLKKKARHQVSEHDLRFPAAVETGGWTPQGCS